MKDIIIFSTHTATGTKTAGLGAVALISYRTAGFPAKWQAIGIAVGCWLLAALTLPMAWVGLMSNFGG